MPVADLNPKERVRRVVEALPDDVSLEDVIARLIVLHKVERGLAQARQGENLMTQAEVEAHFARRREART